MKNELNEKTEEIYELFTKIFIFENDIEKLYKNYNWNETNKAFIVRLKDYEDFKDNIFFDILKSKNKDKISCKEKIYEFLESNKINEIKKIEKVFIKSSNELLNLLYSKNEYKLISLELGNIICKENDSKRFYLYIIDYPEIILYIDIDDIIIFGCNNNIINEDCYTSIKSQKLINIAKSIIEYNRFIEIFRKQIKHIKDFQDKIHIGYLVDEKWIDQWKKFVNYENINFNIIDKEEIIKQLLFYYNNETKVVKPSKIKLLKFQSRTEMRNYLSCNSLAIINSKFYHLITKLELNNKYEIQFSYGNGKITIYINNKPLELNCENNIINSKYKEVSPIEEKQSFLSNFVIFDNNNKKEKDNYNKQNDDFINSNKDIYIFDNINNIQNKNILENNNDNDNIPDNIIKDEKKEAIIFDIKKNNIKGIFIHGPHIGLQNIGATCYMNSTLQCFCHIEKFVNFFKYNPQINNYKNKNNLTSSFILLIDNLWPDNYDPFSPKNKNKYYAPEEFKKKISKMNKLFEGIAANDSKDLVNFIIMTLHEELNKATNKNNIINNINIDQRNNQLMFNNFAKEFMDKNKSIISDLFYSINCNITECLNCHNKLYNYQTYFFLTFPLEEVRKYKIEKMNNNNIIQFNQFYSFNIINNTNMNEVNIYECFDYDRKYNFMCGENSLYCNNCKINCNGSMMTYLVTGPEILILILNRGKGIEFDVRINFQENLNLYNYIEYKDTGYNYKLIGVITHIGESSMSGHFIAYCKDPIIEKWFKYNDAIVAEVIDFKEVINFAKPYLLFYQKIN